jgi:chromate transport protein ChrA
VVDLVSVSLGLVQIIVQLAAVYLAYRLSRITGAFRAWYMVILALVLMTVRRVTALMIQTGWIPAEAGSLAYIDQILLPLAISVLLVVALFELVRLFEKQSKTPN